MAKHKLILFVSERMDSNKKKGRDEHGLLRMSAMARKASDLDGRVDIVSSTAPKSIALDIFQAFSDDVKTLKAKIDAGEITTEDLKRVGFVTAKTFEAINGKGKTAKEIWASEDNEDIVLGADPEFLLFAKDQNTVIRANEYLPKVGPIGCDGAMAEVRPDPAIDPAALVENIRKIFASKTNATKAIQNFRWMTECYYKDHSRDYPVGGHIHVGNAPAVSRMAAGNKKLFFCTINKVMDEHLAIPMMKLDGTENGSCRRINCMMGLVHGNHRGYGYFGEWRPCKVDGEEHFEYRTISGMWLLHPSVAKALLGTARVIVDEIIHLARVNKFSPTYLACAKFTPPTIWQEGFDGWNDIPLARDMRSTKSSTEMIKLLNSSSTSSVSKTLLSDWHSHLKTMASYKRYQHFVDALYEILCLPSKELTKWDRQIQTNWLGNKKFLVDI